MAAKNMRNLEGSLYSHILFKMLDKSCMEVVEYNGPHMGTWHILTKDGDLYEWRPTAWPRPTLTRI